ncbi:hypothetical protein [Paraferrimonas sp. SM1919]|uniref:hypothetical protein n=1 Tax=Paraferrimonas sp. SM1919 TaxID=2662263 RepID=UPI0013D0DEA0|nr:hypothetical protein [Paraferrimonas sp. SM1919]
MIFEQYSFEIIFSLWVLFSAVLFGILGAKKNYNPVLMSVVGAAAAFIPFSVLIIAGILIVQKPAKGQLASASQP